MCLPNNFNMNLILSLFLLKWRHRRTTLQKRYGSLTHNSQNVLKGHCERSLKHVFAQATTARVGSV